MSNITVRTLKLIPIGKDGLSDTEAYKFISDATYAQYQALNRAMSFMMATYYKHKQDFKCEDYKEDVKAFKYNSTNPVFEDIQFGTGIDTLSAVQQHIKSDFSTALKNGLAKGERSINNYKRTYPLLTRARNLKMYYNDDNEVFIKWVHGITFKVIIGRKDKDFLELSHTINKIIIGEYKLGESRITIEGKFIKIKMTIDMGEVKTKTADTNNILGLDLGINIPVYASLGNNTYVRKSFGSKDEFLKVREQFRNRRRRAYKQAELAKGGKGRKDKLSAPDRLSDKERRWANTYNHQLSKKVVEFAVKNNVGQINMEKLEKNGFDNKLLGMWSYYELQNMIEYKGKREGIIVKYINPAYTSQTCSKCGHIHKDNRKSQEHFECVRCGHKLNADHNAAINIARSEDYK